jgi:hypothetical protein
MDTGCAEDDLFKMASISLRHAVAVCRLDLDRRRASHMIAWGVAPQEVRASNGCQLRATRALSATRARQLIGLSAGESLINYRDRAILKTFLWSGIRLGTGCWLKVGACCSEIFVMDKLRREVNFLNFLLQFPLCPRMRGATVPLRGRSLRQEHARIYVVSKSSFL